MTRIHAEGITVRDNDVEILHPTNVTIEPGLTIIAGPSGSGKSTLASVLFGLKKPDTGEVTHTHDNEVVFQNVSQVRRKFGARMLNSFRLETRDEKAAAEYRRRQLGFIAQNPYFPEHVEVGKYIDLVQKSLGLPVEQDDMNALYERLGIEAHIRKTTHEISGGEVQRFAIALGIGGKNLIFGDEPEASLDTANKTNLWQILSEISGSQTDTPRTVVAVSHDPQAVQYADRVIRMRDGNITDIQ